MATRMRNSAVRADVQAVVDVDAPAELDEATAEQADQRRGRAAQRQHQQDGLDAFEQVVLNQRDTRRRGRSGDEDRAEHTKRERGADQGALADLAVGQRLQKNLGNAPLGDARTRPATLTAN